MSCVISQLEGVEKTRLSLEQQTEEVRVAVNEKLENAAAHRDGNIKKMVERLKEHVSIFLPLYMYRTVLMHFFFFFLIFLESYELWLNNNSWVSLFTSDTNFYKNKIVERSVLIAIEKWDFRRIKWPACARA